MPSCVFSSGSLRGRIRRQNKKACRPVIINIDETGKGTKFSCFAWRVRVRSSRLSRSNALSETVIDRIYECAFAPEHWPGVFDDLAKIAEARGGFLFTANRKVVNWTASASLQAGMQAFVAGDFCTRSSRAARALASGHAGFLREYDIFTDDELAMIPSIATYCGRLG
jgi:hypothetical protein